MEDVKIRVQRGAQRLDLKKPDWFERVMLGDLDESNVKTDVLAHVYGNRGAGLAHLGKDVEDNPVAFGFDGWTEFAALQCAWEVAILERLATPAVVPA